MSTKPNVLVSEKEKTSEWIKDMIMSYSKDYGLSTNVMKKDIICFNYYNNISDPEDFSYLTKVGKRTLPAKLNFIPLQRPIIDTLISEYTLRAFVFSCFLDDEDSIKEKNYNKAKVFFEKLNAILKGNMYSNNERMMAMRSKIQELTDFVQKEPESQDEAIKQQQVRDQLPQIRVQLNTAMDLMQGSNEKINEQIEELTRNLNYKYKDIKEIVAYKLLRKYYNLYNIKAKGTENFRNNLITGKQYYYVDYIPGSKDPIFENVDVLEILYPSVDNVDWIQDLPWVKRTVHMSYEDLVVQFGDEFVKKYSREELEALEDSTSSASTGSFLSTPEGAMYTDQPYAGNNTSSGIKVEYIWYKSPVKINIKLSENKYTGDYFRKFLDKYKEVIDQKDYYYTNNQYVNKSNNKIVKNSSDVEVYDSRKGQKVKTKYSTDLYMGVVIGGEYVVRECKSPVVIRDPQDYSKINLPIFGRSFNKVTKRPYSLVWSTKGLQDLYNIVYYHRELMLNLAGTKTIIFDRAQKPSTLNDTEWEEQKKLGTINIQTTTPEGSPIRTNFNQWSMHDLSVSPAIQYLENMLLGIKETMGEIIGVPRSRMGNVVNADQVGTMERSLERSMVITEILFYESDEVLARAMSQLLNIAIKYVYKDGGIFQYINNDLMNEVVTINKDMFKGEFFSVYALNNNEEATAITEMKELLMVGYKSGNIPYSDMVAMFPAESSIELKNKIEYFSKKAQRLQQEAAEADKAHEKDLQEQAIRFQQEFDAFWKKEELALEKAKLQADEEREAAKIKILEQKNIIEANKVQIDKYLKLIELANEKDSEDKAVGANLYTANLNAKLSMMDSQLNYLINLERDSTNERIQTKKAEVDKIKAKKMVREHVSDK